MNKLLTMIMSFIFVATAFTSANSVEVRIGATAQGAAFYGNADEVLKDSGHKSSEEVIAAFNYGSAFAEVAFDEVYGVTLGMEYTPESINIDKHTRTVRDSTLPGLAAQTGNDTGDQVLEAVVEDLITLYVAVPIMDSGLYAKVGYIQASLQTKEVLATGSTYKDVDLAGMEYGVGYMGDITDKVFFKVEGMFIDFDDISASGSQVGGTALSFNKISAELGGIAAKASIGVRF
jgi:hypothetical protein